MSNYVQRLKQKVSDVIFECESLEEYLGKLASDGEHTVSVSDTLVRVERIREIAEKNV